MLIRCTQLNFESEFQIRCCHRTLAVNPNFTTGHTIRHRILIRYQLLNFESELQIHCRQFNFDSESQIRYSTHNSAANFKFAANHTISVVTPNFLQDTQSCSQC